MSLGNRRPERLRDSSEPISVFLRWPSIAAALLFIWPLGLALMIARITRDLHSTESIASKKVPVIPYAHQKSSQEKEKFLVGQKHRRKIAITAVVVAVLFLLLGCYGITKDYFLFFFQKEAFLGLLSSFFGSMFFLLVGMYAVVRSYTLILQGRRFQAVIAALNGAQAISVSKLAQKLSCTEEQLTVDLLQMISALYFGGNAYLDDVTNILYCDGRAEYAAET